MSDSRQLFNHVTFILGALFEREEAHLTKRELDMVSRHTQSGGSSDGFRHMGIVYTQLTGAGRSRGKYDRLNSELSLDMADLVKDRQSLASEKDRIKQALAMVLRGCTSFQDMRDALPNGLKDFIPECAKLLRTRPEAFTLVDNQRAYSQYFLLREKIEYYIASRLLY